MECSELVTYFKGLRSPKVTERRKSVERLTVLLENQTVLCKLNDGSTNISWTELVENVHLLLKNDAHKLYEDHSKKRTTNISFVTTNGDLFLSVVKKGCSATLLVTELTKLIIQFFNSKLLQKYFGTYYLIILRDYVLSNRKNYGKISSEEWIHIFSCIKNSINNTDSHLEEHKLLQCLLLIIKWGPMHCLPASYLQKEFDFVTEICHKLESSLTKNQQDVIINLLLEFCYHMYQDNRVACCRLGENVFSNLIEVYNCHTDVKISIMKFLLLQMKIHHPKGAVKGSSLAYAVSWGAWSKYLRSLYAILCQEVAHKEQVQRKLHSSSNQNHYVSFHEIFVCLFVEVFQQVNYGDILELNSTDEPSNKRHKANAGISTVINNIQELKDWPWINITSEILKKYPTIISESDFICLLRILLALQAETNFPELNYHLYQCLTVLVDVESKISLINCQNANSMWIIISECTLRAVGLNQIEEQTHKLLQKLILSNKIINSSPLFKTYMSGVVTLSKHSIRSLYYACAQFQPIVTDTNGNNKCRILIDWVLKENHERASDTDSFSELIVAEILIYLTLKQWPFDVNKIDTCDDDNDRLTKDLYLLTLLDDIIMGDVIESGKHKNFSCIENTSIIQNELLEYLKEKLLTFLNFHVNANVKSTIKALNIINIIILTSNVVSVMIRANIINENDIIGHPLLNVVNEAFQKWFVIMVSLFQSLNKKKKVDCIYNILIKLKKLFESTISAVILLIVKKLISTNFIKLLFEFINCDDIPTEEIESVNKLRLLVVDSLCTFASVSNKESEFEVQQQVLHALADPNINIYSKTDYNKTMAFLNSLKRYNVGTLSDSVLEKILQSIQLICEAHYSSYDTAIEILQVLYDLIPHINTCIRIELKNNFITILQVFYSFHKQFGPLVAVGLLNNFRLLSKVDVNTIWARWQDNKEIVYCIPEFLKSNYQLVRLQAIKNLANIFCKCPQDKFQENCQKYLFNLICDKSWEVFNIEGNITEDCKIDESVARTASVLHTFASIASISVIFRKKALFMLLKLVHEKNVDKALAIKIMEIVAKHLNIASTSELLKLNLNYLISWWNTCNFNIREFPYSLLNCDSIKEFCFKYIDILMPTLLKSNKLLLEETCKEYQYSIEDILKVSCPKVVAEYIINTIHNININNLCNEEINFIHNETTNEIVQIKLEQIICCLLEYCFDPIDVKYKFGTYWALSEPQVLLCTVDQLRTCIHQVEVSYLNGAPVIQFCSQKNQRKAQEIILTLISKIHKTTYEEEKVLAFHQFTVFIDFITPYLKEDNDLNGYLFRTIIYTIMHLLSDHSQNNIKLNVIYCKYLNIFLSSVLVYNCKILEKFLIPFVTTLIPISKINNNLGIECIKLLTLIVVDHGKTLASAIKMLDPFPSDSKFFQIQSVYFEIKYEGTIFTLKQEIDSFLKTGALVKNVGNRTEGISYLRKQLSKRRTELKKISLELNDLRGSQEIYRNSILHQLIRMLIKLSLSNMEEESLEALKCLGELGALNLLSTISKEEENDYNTERNPSKLVTASVLQILFNYIVDNNIDVMKISNQILYLVLDSNDGKSVLNSFLEKDEKLDKQFIAPFINIRTRKCQTKYKLVDNFHTFVDCSSLWSPQEPTTHKRWITKLVSSLLSVFSETSYLRDLIPLCEIKIEFAEIMLPFVVYLIVECGQSELISKLIDQFFLMHWLNAFSETNPINYIAINKASVQCMLNVVSFMRIRINMENNMKYKQYCLNYLHIAQAAKFCTAHFTALLYIELWCQEKLNQIQNIIDEKYVPLTSLTFLDVIVQHDELNGEKLQHILRECYKNVGETDALQICASINLSDAKVQIEYYEHLQRWDRVALLYDIEISQGKLNYITNVLDSLKKFSLFELPYRYYHSHNQQYDCAWRLSQWNITESTTITSFNSFEQYRYFILKAIYENDESNFYHFINDARNFTLNCLKLMSLESTNNLYKSLIELQSLHELEEFFKLKTERNFEMILDKWKERDEININEFQFTELIYTQRTILLQNLVLFENFNLTKQFVEMQLQLAGIARTSGNHNTALRIISNLLNMSELSEELCEKIKYEEAQLRWVDDKLIARQILRNIINKSNISRMKAAALKLYGTWMIETSSENPEAIINNYFLKSIDLLNNIEKSEEDKLQLYDMYDILARFADSQYQQVRGHIKSSFFERKIRNMEKSKSNALNIKRQASNKITSDEQRAIVTYERQSAIDQTEIDNTFKEKRTYLLLAIKYYIWNLEKSDKNNVRIFRILSLLLENKLNTDLESVFNKNVSKIPSYKFIPILPQLIPHISINSADTFAYQINAIIDRCSRDHPHHTLPFVLSLAYSNEDRSYYKSITNTSSNEQRIEGAKKLIESLEKTSSLRNMIANMTTVSKALIHLAYLDENMCTLDKNKEFTIPSNCKITKIKNFTDILLPTCILNVQKNGDYSKIVGIFYFSKSFANVGGLNAPKRISCIGTDGIKRNQLVKGKDDLRQDAVMQQVFNIMNELLGTNKQTFRLMIRTYKIVPLSQRSGVLEWVDNSMPIGEYLCGDGKCNPGAHVLYNSDDITPARCRLEFKGAAKLSFSEKLKVYNKICKRFHPVFHKFFENSFVEPVVWYERKRAYIYSVATTSMCGYILGLGDRHVSNILIDKSSAEVVHIDFGIAFEQGQVLPTPETVPFRLTRDIEAGMGVSGIEGIFRKSCENTLRVLKENSETILSILEVLLYDPLYAWTVTPIQAYNHQLNEDNDDTISTSIVYAEDENINTTAERSLLRLRQKLQGVTEGGTVTNIQGQVERLLQQARDPSNLCRLFHGWQPYL